MCIQQVLQKCLLGEVAPPSLYLGLASVSLWMIWIILAGSNNMHFWDDFCFPGAGVVTSGAVCPLQLAPPGSAPASGGRGPRPVPGGPPGFPQESWAVPANSLKAGLTHSRPLQAGSESAGLCFFPTWMIQYTSHKWENWGTARFK